MAEALTRRRARRGKAVDARERELKRLKLSVCDDVGFRLYLATYDLPKRRDELIERVLREAEAEKVRVTRLDLGEAKPDTNLVGLLRAHLQETDLPPGWRQTVMVTGIEQRLEYARGREGYAFLHQANLLRDALPEAAPVPVVLWLSRMASAALPAEAPDLWHWRAANFDFTGDEAPRLELLRELTMLRPEDDLGMSGEQRRARLRMLEDLLAELEREGPRRSKRQKAERADLLLQLGNEDRRLGRAFEAIPCLERALDDFREIGDRQGECAALGSLGNAYADLGEPRRAFEYYQEWLKIAREIGDRRGEGQALGSLGNVDVYLGEPWRAIEHYGQVLTLMRKIGDGQGEASTLGNLGVAYADLGEPRRAIECLEEALVISKALGDRRSEGQDLGNLGLVYADLSEPRRAIEHYQQALALMRAIGDRQGEGQTLGNLGSIYVDLGEPRRGIEHHEQSLKITREIGDRRGEAIALFNSALAFDQLGDRDEAIKRMKVALGIFEQIEDPNAERARAQLAEWRGEASG